jgi:hypothetical protein
VVEQMPELMQKAERGPAADARDAQVDGIAQAEAIGAGLGDSRCRNNRYR